MNSNVALHQTAMQLSDYTDPSNGQVQVASFVNDGNRGDPHASTNGDASIRNWWAVDLGRLTFVDNVTITAVIGPATRNGKLFSFSILHFYEKHYNVPGRI